MHCIGKVLAVRPGDVLKGPFTKIASLPHHDIIMKDDPQSCHKPAWDVRVLKASDTAKTSPTLIPTKQELRISVGHGIDDITIAIVSLKPNLSFLTGSNAPCMEPGLLHELTRLPFDEEMDSRSRLFQRQTVAKQPSEKMHSNTSCDRWKGNSNLPF